MEPEQTEKIFDKYNEFIKFSVPDIEEKLHFLPSMIGYYQNVFYTLRQKHTRYNHQLDSTWQEKYLYYKNDFNFSLTNAEIKSFIEKDLEYLEAKFKLRKVTDLLEQVEMVLKGLDNFRWTIHDLIAWEQFQQGKF